MRKNFNQDVSGLPTYVDEVGGELVRKPVLASLPMFENKEDAEAMALAIGCKGSHTHQYGDKTLYMPCESHPEEMADLSEACWPGYEAIGMKDDGTGKMVPNCVPIKEEQSAQKFASYNDYPEAAKTNACRAVKWAEKNGWGDCLQAEGKNRANQLCKGENISEDTIARMSAFRRHQQHKDVPYEEGCGGIAWDAWGGDAGIDWAERKLNQIRKEDTEMSFSVFNAEERLVVGPAMIPDKMIIRRNEITGEIYYVYFTAETIKKLQQKFMQEKLLGQTNIEHGRRILSNVDVVESWIVDDPKLDKQQVFGMEYPKGTWMISMKVMDDDTWSKVKDGKLRGFSVQGYFLEKAKFGAVPNKILDEIKNILKSIK